MGRVLRLALWHGDCRVRLREIPSDSVDLVLTDPPYELTSSKGGKGGFMGMNWDATGVAFDPEVYELMMRVLRLGAWAKVFSATRTFHRVCQVMERVGFEGVKDNLEGWAYGCLDAQSEILTETGWKRGVEVHVGEQVACWCAETETISLRPVEAVTQAPFKGDMVRFVNDHTDQMLTPNHRVYGRQRILEDGTDYFEPHWAVREAGKVTRDTHLLLPLAGCHKGEGLKKHLRYVEFLAWVWLKKGWDLRGSKVQLYQNEEYPAQVAFIQALVEELGLDFDLSSRVRNYTASRESYTERVWSFARASAQIQELLSDPWALLWRMSLTEKTLFIETVQKNKAELLPRKHEELVWFQTLCHFSGMQLSNFEFQNSSITILRKHHLQRHHREHYEGEVWCVKVPTGAFLARRAGKIFVTGNSGFPKSLAVLRKGIKPLLEKKLRQQGVKGPIRWAK